MSIRALDVHFTASSKVVTALEKGLPRILDILGEEISQRGTLRTLRLGSIRGGTKWPYLSRAFQSSIKSLLEASMLGGSSSLKTIYLYGLDNVPASMLAPVASISSHHFDFQLFIAGGISSAFR
ncbi:hypothetical protein BDZ97DRAFT_1347354 [Flammula alnicola]|nr:hypothetical protein BDZ97DRAFT_1347354 [Flammula alnicola]